MKLDRLHLDNFSSFKKKTIIFKDLNFLIGANGTGKSKILEVFKIIKSYLENRLNEYPFKEYVYDKNDKLQVRISFDFILTNEERNNIIDFTFGASNFDTQSVFKTNFAKKIRFRIDFMNDGIKNEVIRVNNIESGWVSIVNRKLAPDNTLQTSHISMIQYGANLSELVNMVFQAVVVHETAKAFNHVLADNSEFDQCELFIIDLLRTYFNNVVWFEPYRNINYNDLSLGHTKLASSGENVIPVLRNIAADDSWEYVRVSREIRETIPNIEKNSSPMEDNIPTLKFHERGLTTPLDLVNMSTGIKQISTLIAGIDTASNSTLTLIEEPEAHIHASAQRKLLSVIKDKRNMQFIIATHSTIFTGCDDRCSTILLTKTEGLTNVKIVNNDEFSVVRKMLGHRNADLFYDECVVFLEGDSECIFFPIIFDYLGYDLKNYGIKLINVRGKDNFFKIEKTLEYLKDTETLSYIIADGNKKLSRKIPEWEINELIKTGSSTIWEIEFEDLFTHEVLVNAVNIWLSNLEYSEEIDVAYITENIKKDMSIVKVVDKYLYENDLPKLDKPSLAENLAEFVIKKHTRDEILSTNYGHCISRIIEMVDLKNESGHDII